MSSRHRRNWLPILSGILIGTSYIPFPPWALFFLFVPLWIWWLEQSSLKGILFGGWLTQAVLTLIGFNWVTYTIHEFGHLPWAVAVLGMLLFSAIAHLHIPLAGLLWWGVCRIFKWPRERAIWLLPAAHIVATGIYPMIFEWHLGYTLLFSKLPIAQTAEWFGFRGLDGLILLANATVLVLWRERKRKNQAWRSKAIALAITFVALHSLGGWLQKNLPPTDDVARVQIVQANIGNLEKQQVEKGELYREKVLQDYIRLTEQGLDSKPDFSVWPETAFPHLLSEPHFSTNHYALRLRTFLRERQLALATGAYSLHPQTEQVMNSFFTFNADGQLSSPAFSKTRLLAFGEYLPGADLFPILKEWLPEVGTFGRGSGPMVMTLGRFRLGPQICYEGLFDDFTRSLALQNAQILINVTNDSWYGKWQQPWQHMYMTLARTIEVRRPLIRATNTGISTVILADGTILEQSPLHKAWQKTYEVPLATTPKITGFMRWGFYFPWFLAGLLWALTFWSFRHGRASQS